MNRNLILEKIRPLFEKNDEIAAVYLFGSQATRKANSQSDIDLAILFEQRLPRFEAYQRREKYFAKLARALHSEPDIVDMEEVNLVLLFEILCCGEMLIENNRDKNRRFQSRKIIECIDFQFVVKRCAEGMHRKSVEKIHGQDFGSLQESLTSSL